MTTTHNGHLTIEGVVQAVNSTGVKLNRDWLNISKYRTLELPDTGARVRAEVDNRGYLCSVEVLEPGALDKTPAVLSRNETITRLAVLKAAANFVGLMGQCREDVRSEHVLPLAEKWLAWIEQRDG